MVLERKRKGGGVLGAGNRGWTGSVVVGAGNLKLQKEQMRRTSNVFKTNRRTTTLMTLLLTPPTSVQEKCWSLIGPHWV